MNAYLLSLLAATLSACHQAAGQADNDEGRLPPLEAIAEPAAHPPDKMLDRIEKLVRLPSGADPLAKYRRYYAVDSGSAGKPRRIVAVYTTLAASPGRQWASPTDLPTIFDGGCGVIQIIYDVAQDKIVSARCNGLA